MKIWGVPIDLPDPEKSPEQAKAAGLFVGSLKGLVCVGQAEGASVLVFETLESARAARWRFEEYNATGLEIIEGRMKKDGAIDLHRIVKGG